MERENDFMENHEEKSCGRVAYAYVPMQWLGDLYSVEEGLIEGTIFPELDIPAGEYSPMAR